MEILGAFLFFFYSLFVGTKCDDEVCYLPRITDSVVSCDNFDNDALDCNGLVLGSKKDDDGNEVAKLGGIIEITQEFNDGLDIEVDIWKQMDVGDEYMYNIRLNFCESLKDEDAPWAPIMKSMNISSCPVACAVFEVAEIGISLDSVKDFLCHEFCGAYRVELSFVDKTTKISCHVIELSIIEEEVKDK